MFIVCPKKEPLLHLFIYPFRLKNSLQIHMFSLRCFLQIKYIKNNAFILLSLNPRMRYYFCFLSGLRTRLSALGFLQTNKLFSLLIFQSAATRIALCDYIYECVSQYVGNIAIGRMTVIGHCK